MSKEKILKILLNNSSFISGETISGLLGISRSAVWKHIKALRSEGYVIKSVTNNGYLLIKTPETLSVDEVRAHLNGDIKDIDIRVFDSVISTNTVAKRLAEDEGLKCAVVAANEQTGGKGRMGRSFFSVKDKGLYFSVLIKPEKTPDKLMLLTAVSALAVSNAINRTCGIKTGIKWPNDIYYGGKKLCGILTEMSLESETNYVKHAVVGIGINVNTTRGDFPAELKETATSLFIITAEKTNRCFLLAAVLNEFFEIYNKWTTTGDSSGIIMEYTKRQIIFDKDISIIGPNGVSIARAVGIDENGALMVLQNDELKTINSGEISVRL